MFQFAQKNISSFLSPSKNTKLLKLESNICNGGNITGSSSVNIPSIEKKNISLKRCPKKRKYKESPIKV